jgi:outer membrane protein W
MRTLSTSVHLEFRIKGEIQNMRIRIFVYLAALLFAFSLAAQTNHVTFLVNSTTFESTSETDPDLGTVKLSFNTKVGYGVAFDHFVSPNLSVQLLAQRLRADTQLDFAGISTPAGTLDLNQYDAALHWYFLSQGAVRPYAGGGVARIQGGKLHIPAEVSTSGADETISLDGKTTWVADAGIDIRAGANAAIVVSAKYVPYKTHFGAAPGDPIQEMKLNPVTFAAGFRWRF